MSRLGQDLRFAVRTAIRTRAVAGLAILAFALGIGVTTAVFSIFSGVLLAPLPFPDPDELVAVYDTQPACATCPASFPKFQDWKARNQVFAAIGGSSQASFVLTGLGSPEQVSGLYTTASLNDVFRVQPILGRWYTEEEGRFGGPKVVVLSYRFWQRKFNGDPSAVGRRLVFDGEPYEVIGVLPASFAFPSPGHQATIPCGGGKHAPGAALVEDAASATATIKSSTAHRLKASMWPLCFRGARS